MQQQLQPGQQITQAPPPANRGGLFNLGSKKLFGGTGMKGALSGGGALLAGLLGKKAIDQSEQGQTAQQQTVPANNYLQQTQYQQPQQDPNPVYGYTQPVQNQTQPGTSGYDGGYTDPSPQEYYVEPQQNAVGEIHSAEEDSYSGYSNAEQIYLNQVVNADQKYLDDQAVNAAGHLSEMTVEAAEANLELL
jgi:hypothetical protein